MIDSHHLLRGQRIWLTALRRADAAVMARWEYDSEYLRLMDAGPAHPRTEEEIIRWLDSAARSHTEFTFGIRLIDSDELIGWTQLDGIDWIHRTTALGIGIGNRNFWDNGYGTEAITLLLDFAFRELNLHRVFLTVFSYNRRAIHLYEKLGFRHEGTHREHIQRSGRRYDMLLYGILNREWAQQRNGF
ncbi:MAG TPA: GNAT family protein [Spirillospora sp.]|nr:GNAT family protein [Spirillospora sp.]